MSDDCDTLSHMCSLPTELLLDIYSYLPAIDLIKCRQVCSRWKTIIDSFTGNHELWLRFSRIDFPAIYRRSRLKASSTVSWFNFYKSMYLWRKLAEAWEETDEFASAAGVMQEIRSFEIVPEDMIGVLSKSAITYYDTNTLERSARDAISGSYSRYNENCNAIVISNYELHLFIIRKSHSTLPIELNRTFDNVKLYTLTEDAVYFVTLSDEIYVSELQRDDGLLKQTYMNRSEDGVMALGFSNGHLNILTFNRTIYTMVNNQMVFACTLGQDCNLFYQLQKYNLLDQMDWRVYIQWMHVFRHTVPDGLFLDLIIVRQYGDVFFVGSNWGVLRIYYAPSFDMNIDLFSMEPIKQYNFMERVDCPVLSTCPIIGVDIVEIKDGHRVYVAMPKKIAVLTFTHLFKKNVNLSMLPYDEVQRVKLLKIEDTL